MQIDNALPIPDDDEVYTPRSNRRFHLDRLEVGQSILLPVRVQNAYVSAQRQTERTGFEYKVKSESIDPPSTRVWRVA